MVAFNERRRSQRRATDRDSAAEIINLKRALRTRHEIGVAQGALMERYGLDEGAAFRYLARISQETNVKLYLVAAKIVKELGAGREHPALSEEDGMPERPTA